MTGYEIDNKLFDLLSTEQISFGAYAVGHYIKKIQNQKGIRVFTFVISSMATTMGISRQVGSKYFHELVNCGFIKVIEMTAKKGVKIYLDVNDGVNDGVKIINIKTSDVNDDVINDVNDGVNDDVKKINTLKKEERKTKKEEDIIIKPKIEKLNLPKSTMQPVEKVDLETISDYLTEQITENYYLLKQATNYDLSKLLKSIQPFILHQQLQQTKYVYRSDVYKHFARWIRTFDVDREQPNQPKKKAGEMSADEIAKWVSNQLNKNHDN